MLTRLVASPDHNPRPREDQRQQNLMAKKKPTNRSAADADSCPAPTNEEGLIDLAVLETAAECLKTIAHPHRLRIIQMLLQGEYTVGELAEACDIPSHMASEHLGKMKDRGLLNVRREGRRMFYSVARPGLRSIIECVECHFHEQ